MTRSGFRGSEMPREFLRRASGSWEIAKDFRHLRSGQFRGFGSGGQDRQPGDPIGSEANLRLRKRAPAQDDPLAFDHDIEQLPGLQSKDAAGGNCQDHLAFARELRFQGRNISLKSETPRKLQNIHSAPSQIAENVSSLNERGCAVSSLQNPLTG